MAESPILAQVQPRIPWSHDQLLVAFALYCRIPFGRLHKGNPEIIRIAQAIGRTPSALAMKLVNIAGLDPTITSTGRRGLTNASAGDRRMWDEMHGDWERFAVESDRALAAAGAAAELGGGTGQDVESDGLGPAGRDLHAGEERITLTSTRIGQDFFRRAVLSAYDEKCCITGLGIPNLLVASHIVPWHVDTKNRLNPRNGLALSALHDKAFDLGLITLLPDLTVRVSPKYADLDDHYFATAIRSFAGNRIATPDKFAPDPKFLAYHRDFVFHR
jgi:hypothetical protein